MTIGNTVLVVEDDALIRVLLEEMLTCEGYEVVCARAGDQAISLLQTGSANLCAAVIDILLGPGPDGWEVAQVARDFVPGLPVLYMTAGPLDGWDIEGVPGSYILDKPFLTDDLLVALSNVVQRRALVAAYQSHGPEPSHWDRRDAQGQAVRLN